MRREDNEDSYCARPDLGLFVVADGLGGHAAGQVASRTAVDAIEAVIAGTLGFEDLARWDISPAGARAVDRLRDAVRVANARIALRVADAAELHGMATTLAAVLFEAPPDHDSPPSRLAVVGHVGDSRVYRWSSGRLARLTADHSWVEEQVRAGVLSADEARHHPWRNLVTRVVGGERDLWMDVAPAEFDAGDRILICSDGLSSVLSDDDIARVFSDGASDEQACDLLVHSANLAGGPDNITVIVLTI